MRAQGLDTAPAPESITDAKHIGHIHAAIGQAHKYPQVLQVESEPLGRPVEMRRRKAFLATLDATIDPAPKREYMQCAPRPQATRTPPPPKWQFFAPTASRPTLATPLRRLRVMATEPRSGSTRSGAFA